MDLERLDRFVRREGTPAELAALERWVNADARRVALAEAMRTIGAPSPRPSAQWDAQRALRRLGQSVARGRYAKAPGRHGERIRQVLGATPRGWSPQRVARASGVAAALVAAVGVYVLDRPGSVDTPSAPPREVVTAPGQRAVMELTDGTQVVLSAESHLRIPGDFGGRTTSVREVWLEGEARFSVKHDSTRPFIVHTPHGSAEDLGTEFVVNTYPEVDGMRLAVREGRVAIRPGTSDSAGGRPSSLARAEGTVVLEEGDVALLRLNGRLDVTHRADLSNYFAGTDGSLVLRGAPLRDAIPLVERWFGIRVHVRDRALLSRKVSGEFRRESATEALSLIAIALHSKAHWHQNQVTLVSDPRRGEDR